MALPVLTAYLRTPDGGKHAPRAEVKLRMQTPTPRPELRACLAAAFTALWGQPAEVRFMDERAPSRRVGDGHLGIQANEEGLCADS